MTYHASHTPDVSTRSPFGTQDDFGGSILPRLDIVGEMMSNPASVTEIGNLDRDSIN